MYCCATEASAEWTSAVYATPPIAALTPPSAYATRRTTLTLIPAEREAPSELPTARIATRKALRSSANQAAKGTPMVIRPPGIGPTERPRWSSQDECAEIGFGTIFSSTPVRTNNAESVTRTAGSLAYATQTPSATPTAAPMQRQIGMSSTPLDQACGNRNFTMMIFTKISIGLTDRSTPRVSTAGVLAIATRARGANSARMAGQ